MVEDIDEAAVYGSPMYRLLEEIFGAERPASEESVSSDDGHDEAANPAADESAAAAQPPVAAESTDGGERNNVADFDRAWRLFGKAETDARAVLAVLTRIHGESMDAWWPLVRATLPPGEVIPSVRRVHARRSTATNARISSYRSLSLSLETSASPFLGFESFFTCAAVRLLAVPQSSLFAWRDSTAAFLPASSDSSPRCGKTRRGEGKRGSEGRGERGGQGEKTRRRKRQRR